MKRIHLRSLLGVGVAAASCWAVSMRAQRPAVPVPPPFADEKTDRYASDAVQRGAALGNNAISNLVAQVILVEPEPGTAADLVTRARGNRGMVPSVRAARLAVVETLSGPRAPGTIFLQDPPPPRGLEYSGPLVATRALRRDEYCIVLWDARTGRVVVDPNHGGGIVHLTGPDDPVLVLIRRNIAWQKRRDKATVFAEARAAALNSRETNVSRATAFSPMLMATLTRVGYAEQMNVQLHASLQRTLVEILKDKTAPEELKDQAVNELRVEIDPSKPIAKGSADEFKLRYLLKMLFDKDTMKAAKAGERLYFVCIQSGSENGRAVAYYYPDIIEALEARRDQDRAMESSRPGVGQGVLNNLALAHRRSLAEMQQQGTVVSRKLP